MINVVDSAMHHTDILSMKGLWAQLLREYWWQENFDLRDLGRLPHPGSKSHCFLSWFTSINHMNGKYKVLIIKDQIQDNSEELLFQGSQKD